MSTINSNMNNNSVIKSSRSDHSPPKRNRNFKRVASSVACVMSTTCLTPSSVTAFQGQLSFSTVITKTEQSHRFKVRSLRPNPTELCYRDDPDYISSESRAINNHLSDETKEQLCNNSASSQAPTPQEESSSSKLAPRSRQNQLSNVFHTWWTASKTRRAQESAQEYALEQKRKRSEQYDLDLYLESIDKRYKRLHERELRSSRAQKQQKKQSEGYTSALSWLLATEESTSEALEQRRQEDGIYVLGLAGLASDRLLQKHHLPKPKRDSKHGSPVIDIQSQKIVPSVTTAAATSATPSTSVSSSLPSKLSVGSIVTSITKVGCVLQLLYNMRHIQTALSSCMDFLFVHTKNCLQERLRCTSKAVVNAPSFINTAIGGKWAKNAVVSLVSAIFVLLSNFRPFSKA